MRLEVHKGAQRYTKVHTVLLPEPHFDVKKTMFSILWPKYLLKIGSFVQESGSGRDTGYTEVQAGM